MEKIVWELLIISLRCWFVVVFFQSGNITGRRSRTVYCNIKKMAWL